jgi:hypothetical protein
MAKMTKNEEWFVTIEDGDTPENIISALLNVPPDLKVCVNQESYSRKIHIPFEKKVETESN